jgi:PAS domain S-box-containing protein
MAIRDVEHDLLDFFENASVPLHWLRHDGVIVRANRAELDLLGYTEVEYVGHHIGEFHADTFANEDILDRLNRGETLRDYPARLRAKDGSIRRVRIDSSVYRGSYGEFIHTRCFTRDVTDLVDTEERLSSVLALEQEARLAAENAERRMRVLADIVKSIASALDLDTILRRVVDGARELSCCDTAAIFLRDGDSAEMTPRYRAGPQLAAYGTLRIAPGRGVGGQVVESGRPARTDDYLTDPRVPGDFRPVAQETGTVALMVVPVAIHGRVEGLLYLSNQTARGFSDDDEAISVRLADHAALAIQNATLLAREHASRTDAEAANRAKDEFLAMLSHELRTPLTSILGWTRLLRATDRDEADRARALESIERNARLQAQLIDDLLDVSRIIAGKLELERGPVDVAAVVEAAIETVKLAAQTKGLTITLQTTRDLDLISADARRLQQIVWNLLANAVKFTPAEGHIDVTLDRDTDALRLSVRDTGEGIAPDTLSYVFDRFRQADRATRRAHGGLGLGLAIVQQIVRLHGGTVEAHSAGIGHGTTFTVQLPLNGPQLRSIANAAALTSAWDAALPSLRGVRVLVVDDEADARDLVAALLATCGADVTVVSSAAEALEKLVALPHHVLLADLGMPGQDGYDLIRRVRALGPGRDGVTAIALTAYTTVEDRQRALAAGYNFHLAKPVEPARLVEVIVKAVGRT